MTSSVGVTTLDEVIKERPEDVIGQKLPKTAKRNPEATSDC